MSFNRWLVNEPSPSETRLITRATSIVGRKRLDIDGYRWRREAMKRPGGVVHLAKNKKLQIARQQRNKPLTRLANYKRLELASLRATRPPLQPAIFISLSSSEIHANQF